MACVSNRYGIQAKKEKKKKGLHPYVADRGEVEMLI